MMKLAGILAAPLLLLLAACSSTQTVSDAPSSKGPSATLIAREQNLTHALTHGMRASVNEMLTDDFRCSVTGAKPFELPEGAQGTRSSLCTGMGNDLSNRAPRSAYVEDTEKTLPRTAKIDRIRVELRDGATAVVISTQTYGNWFPYDGSFQRHAEVTDTWSLVNGQWLLKERISYPLDQADVTM